MIQNDEEFQKAAETLNQQKDQQEERAESKSIQQQKNRDRSSSFENRIPKKYVPSSTEFKIHFYVRRVHMNGMKDNEFLSFIKKKVSLAGSCDVVQIFNQKGLYCDVAIGMSSDDNAKLVYIGKKHFNFGRNGQREQVQLSEAFKNFLENKRLLDKDHLERYLRRNQQIRGRSESSGSSKRYKSRSVSKRKKAKKQERRRSSHSSSSERAMRRPKRTRHSYSSSQSHGSNNNIQPLRINNDKNTILIFQIPQEFVIQDIINELVTHKISSPISSNWHNVDQMQYLEMSFPDEQSAQTILSMKPCLHVKGIPLLVIQKKQRPVQELLRNYEVQVELDKDVPAFNMVEEFKKYGELIGIFMFQANRNYLLLYSSSSALQESLKPPIHLTLQINNQQVNANAKIIDKPIDIKRPLMKDTLAYQLNNQGASNQDDDNEHKKRKKQKYKSADKNFKK